jgi:thioredoxin-like negative regulator of GroEL
MIFRNGQEVDQVVGAVPESAIKSMIDALLLPKRVKRGRLE